MVLIVRCPYCVLGDNLRPMLPKAEGLFVCQRCGHIKQPADPDFRCFCQKCVELYRQAA